MFNSKVISHFILSTMLFASTACAAKEGESFLCGSNQLIKLGVASVNLGETSTTFPMAGYGLRYEVEDSALEISMAGGTKELRNKDVTFISFPKMTYLRYLQPHESSSFFYGGGLNYSWIKVKDNHWDYRRATSKEKFSGLLAEAVVGYEFTRNKYFKPIIQLELNQAIVSGKQGQKMPKPFALASFSVGL